MQWLIIWGFLFSLPSFSCQPFIDLYLNNFSDILEIQMSQLRESLTQHERLEPPACPSLDDVKEKKQIIFNFEGAGGYAPKRAMLYKFLEDHNLEGPVEFRRLCIEMNLSGCEDIYRQVYGRETKRLNSLPLALEISKNYMGNKDT